MDEDDIEVVDDVTDDKATDDYLNEILTESQEAKEEPEEFVKNKEGVTGDEWKDEEKERLEKEIKEENRRNAERRIREKKEKEEEKDYVPDEELEAAELENVKEQYEEMSKRMEVAAPVMDYLVQNKIGQEELQLGVDFVNHWRADKIGAVKVLVKALEQQGIDVGQILEHDDRQFEVMNKVNQQMRSVYEERDVARREAESRKVLDGFLTKHPDAWEHLEEITQVMQRTGVRDPYDAYFRLRRVYRNNNEPWIETDMVEEEIEPQVASPRADTYGSYQPTNYDSIEDVISAETRKYFRR